MARTAAQKRQFRVNADFTASAETKLRAPGAPGSARPALEKPISAAKQKALEDKQRKEKFRLEHNYPFKRDGRPMLKEGMQSLVERNCIFVSVDLEMFEFSPNVITEIGVATFELGPDMPIFPNIKAYHLMPLETMNLVNHKIMVNKRHLFVHGDSYAMPMAECRLFWQTLLSRYAAKARAEDKKLFLVGHDVQGDLTCLSSNKFEFDRTLSVLDTLLIWEATCASPPGLGTLLEKLKIPAKYLHNAGNDAVATLRLLLAVLDPQVRKMHKLDEGPSAAEVAAALKAANKASKQEQEKAAAKAKKAVKKDGSKEPELEHEELEEVSAEIKMEPNPRVKKATAAEINALKAQKLERERMRTKNRLNEMRQDRPGKVDSISCRELLDKLDI